MKEAEENRAALIGALDLRVVEGREADERKLDPPCLRQ